MREIARAACLVAVVAAVVLCLGALQGCNTVEGAGKDIEAAGEGIQNAAD